MARPLVILLRSDGWEARYTAATIAVTAAAMGDEVHVALFFGALRAWVDGRFDEGAPPEAGPARITPLRETLEEARRDLGVRVVACDTVVRLASVDPSRAAAALDGIVGLPSLWRLAHEGTTIAI